jgi:hypothetical protein
MATSSQVLFACIAGSTWSYVTPPIIISRNVTISGSSPSVKIDLDFVPDTLHLGRNVQLTFFSINILNGKRKVPLGE